MYFQVFILEHANYLQARLNFFYLVIQQFAKFQRVVNKITSPIDNVLFETIH